MEDAHKKRVHAGYLKALEKYSQADISRDIGCHPDRLRQFKADISLGKQKLDLLEQWLISRGFLVPAPVTPVSARQIFAAALRVIAMKLDSEEFPMEDIYGEFKSLAKRFLRNVPPDKSGTKIHGA